MYPSQREVTRRAWRIIGRDVVSELLWVAAIAGFVLMLIAGIRMWMVSPLLVIVPSLAALLGWLGVIVWTYAVDKARRELNLEYRRAERRELRKR